MEKLLFQLVADIDDEEAKRKNVEEIVKVFNTKQDVYNQNQNFIVT